jgi:hypothetical protein
MVGGYFVCVVKETPKRRSYICVGKEELFTISAWNNGQAAVLMGIVQ